MALTSLIFSSSRTDVSPEAIEAILRASRRNNVRDDFTGALIASRRHFVQLLEGTREEISRCFARVMRDERHENVQIIGSGTVEHRLFPTASM